MIRRPLRPLARILTARAKGENPDTIEAEERAARLRAMQQAERDRAGARLLLLGAVFMLAFTTVAGRMALLSASVPYERQAGIAGQPIVADRAEIVDRSGAILATNLVTASLYAHPGDMVDPRAAAEGLARIFPDLDPEALHARFTDGRKFLWVKRTVSPEQRQAVHDLGEPGLLFGPRETRLYPNGPLAAHVLGGAGFGREGVRAAEVVGTAGVELVFDERLRDPAQAGEPLRLSIDLGAQIALEEVLEAGMERMNAKGAFGILMEARTGKIRALASLPDFDPNHRPGLPTSGDPGDSPLFNRAAQGRYELGSTMKIFPIALALETGLVTRETLIDTKGPMRWGRYTIRDFRNYGPRLTVEDVIVKSSNIGTARIAIEQGSAAQQAFLKRIGFFDPVAVELAEAGRTAPLLPERWSDLTTMTVSYGHGIALTPLHLAAGYAAMVNGGVRVTPSLLEQAPAPAAAGERVISERVSAQVRSMLRQTVSRGTASFADVEGYEVGGKTGTADKPNEAGGYARDKVIATFVGAFPLSDPEYVIVIGLDEPVNDEHDQPLRTAGWTAVPVAGEAIRRLAPMLGMAPLDPPPPAQPLLYTLAGNH